MVYSIYWHCPNCFITCQSCFCAKQICQIQHLSSVMLIMSCESELKRCSRCWVIMSSVSLMLWGDAVAIESWPHPFSSRPEYKVVCSLGMARYAYQTVPFTGQIPYGSDHPYPLGVGTLEWTGHVRAIILLFEKHLAIGLQRLVDIIDNVDNKKLSTNISVVEYSFDLIWPNVRVCNTAVWPAWRCSARL